MALETEVRTLRTANETLKRENALKFASNKSIDELAAKIMELDKNRLNDLDITNKQIDSSIRTVKELAPRLPPPHGTTAALILRQPTSRREHVVQSGEFLSTILEATTPPSRPRGYPAALPNHRSSRPTPDWTPIAFWFAKSCSYRCQAKSSK